MHETENLPLCRDALRDADRFGELGVYPSPVLGEGVRDGLAHLCLAEPGGEGVNREDARRGIRSEVYLEGCGLDAAVFNLKGTVYDDLAANGELTLEKRAIEACELGARALGVLDDDLERAHPAIAEPLVGDDGRERGDLLRGVEAGKRDADRAVVPVARPKGEEVADGLNAQGAEALGGRGTDPPHAGGRDAYLGDEHLNGKGVKNGPQVDHPKMEDDPRGHRHREREYERGPIGQRLPAREERADAGDRWVKEAVKHGPERR